MRSWPTSRWAASSSRTRKRPPPSRIVDCSVARPGAPPASEEESLEVTAQQVKELRERTGAGIMDCRRALQETEGNMDRAADVLREQGIARAEKKMGREARQGLIEAYIQDRKSTRLNSSHV